MHRDRSLLMPTAAQAKSGMRFPVCTCNTKTNKASKMCLKLHARQKRQARVVRETAALAGNYAAYGASEH